MLLFKHEVIRLDEKKRISDAFIELIETKCTNKITVTEVCESIHICRKTFYYYFQDKYELIEYIFFENNIKPLKNSLELGVPIKKCIYNWYKSFFTHKIFYTQIIEDTTQNSLFNIIIKYLPKVGDSYYRCYIDDEKKLDYVSYKFAAMQAMLLRKWMREGMIESPEFMSEVYLFDDGNKT